MRRMKSSRSADPADANVAYVGTSGGTSGRWRWTRRDPIKVNKVGAGKKSFDSIPIKEIKVTFDLAEGQPAAPWRRSPSADLMHPKMQERICDVSGRSCLTQTLNQPHQSNRPVRSSTPNLQERRRPNVPEFSRIR